jgi:methionyl-tRNA synthetase
MSGEHVLICVAWPYANGPLHLGHVAGCYLPPDIHARFERALGNRVLMVSGSDEHGTPITVSAEKEGVNPQVIVDRFHAINSQALLDLGCSWQPSLDSRGMDFGGSLFNRTSDERHKKIVQENFTKLNNAGLFEKRVMKQFYEVKGTGGRFLPDRYVEGICPQCEADGARGDQCDNCGSTYEAIELISPRSLMEPSAEIEIRDTEHLFYRLDLFQSILEKHAKSQHPLWKANVRAMTKNWLDMGLRPRAVTRDLEWGIEIPIDQEEWLGKCIYVWFEAVQGYYSCSRIWAQENGDEDAWEKWWNISDNGSQPRHLYFLGKDNIPFHTIIWPALLAGLNHANAGKGPADLVGMPGPGELALPHNVPAMEYLMLAGGQFSKSRNHAIWLPAFLKRFDPDTLRYHLCINMPENHDTDFNWHDFVEKVNNELIATYGNFVHRVLTLGARFSDEIPLSSFDDADYCSEARAKLETIFDQITDSLSKHRYKEALRLVMSAAQYGNQMLQAATPWKYLKDTSADEARDSMIKLAFGWRISRFIAITSQPFLPFSAQRLWQSLGEQGDVTELEWSQAIDWECPMKWNDETPVPLFTRLDLEEILAQEQELIEASGDEDSTLPTIKGVKKKKEEEKMTEGVTYLDFETFTKTELKVGRITSVEDHDNADKLYVVKIDDGTDEGRTICAGIKEYYTIEQLQNKLVVFVANLKPRKLRGVMSEGMMLAADDGNERVCLITIDGDIAVGSNVK